ncbi:ATP-sensitive inward rectifier potassium channel 1-like [Electrophorus electricus]|uniref:ATP-sensitive inward rectifier potassium channel 1-like n=1 Tax=Electrophorus electricus TaxID=8005 RepID=UPI0015D01C35|nr:ATP-sensitive inward rectifier potassium channel 1-like [Electrophorus electricus]
MKNSLTQLLCKYLAERRLYQSRLVTKDGHCNIEYCSVRSTSFFAYALDLWTTFMEIRWRFVIVLFVGSFTLSWFIFALCWYWIAHNNGELSWQVQPANTLKCFNNVTDLTSAFLFSMETQTTVGYGGRDITANCPVSVALVIIQALVGSIINCFWCGLVMAKITLPKRRAKTITFSKMAVICPKNDTLCLQIQVANLRKTLMIGSQVYGKLIRTLISPEGKTVILDQVHIDFTVDAGKDSLFFICPLTLYHVIDKTSPFSEFSVDTLHQQEFELVVFLDGTAESTSSSCQVRTSYIPKEIMWGYQFLPTISRNKEGKYRVNFSNFDKVEPLTTTNSAEYSNSEKLNIQLSKHGIDNQGFEDINIGDSVTQTKM